MTRTKSSITKPRNILEKHTFEAKNKETQVIDYFKKMGISIGH